MIASWLASRRELQRLAASERHWRGKVVALEKENARLTKELIETHRAFTDRVLTGFLKVPAVGDEIRVNSSDAEDAQEVYNKELQLHLDAKKASLLEQALDAGKGPQDAELKFHELRPLYVAEFENEYGFAN